MYIKSIYLNICVCIFFCHKQLHYIFSYSISFRTILRVYLHWEYSDCRLAQCFDYTKKTIFT